MVGLCGCHVRACVVSSSFCCCILWSLFSYGGFTCLQTLVVWFHVVVFSVILQDVAAYGFDVVSYKCRYGVVYWLIVDYCVLRMVA